jgi:hypothetical protein
MLEKIGQSAEKVVNKVNVSRRGFLGSAAKLVAALGAVAAGVTAFPTEAEAKPWCPRGTKGYCWLPGYTPTKQRTQTNATPWKSLFAGDWRFVIGIRVSRRVLCEDH